MAYQGDERKSIREKIHYLYTHIKEKKHYLCTHHKDGEEIKNLRESPCHGIIRIFFILAAFILFSTSIFCTAFQLLVWKNGIYIVGVSLSVDAIAFSTYFSIRTHLLYSSREADIQAFLNMLAWTKEHDDLKMKSAVYWLTLSEDYRRSSNVRYDSAIMSMVAGIFLVSSLIFAILLLKNWFLYFYTASLFMISLAVIGQIWNMGYVIHKDFRDRLAIIGRLLRGTNRFKYKCCRNIEGEKEGEVLLLPCRLSFMYSKNRKDPKGENGNYPRWWDQLICCIESNKTRVEEDEIYKKCKEWSKVDLGEATELSEHCFKSNPG